MPVESPSLPAGSDSATLVGKLKARQQGAWQRFSDLYGPLVYTWARKAGLQDSDAADVTQEVFQAVAAGIATFRKSEPGDTFRGWLFGIARNKILAELRRRNTHPAATDDAVLQRLIDSMAESAEVLSEELATVVRRALALIRTDFQPVTWQAFEHSVLAGRSAADVSGQLGISVGSVYTAKCRVLSRLRQELGDLL